MSEMKVRVVASTVLGVQIFSSANGFVSKNVQKPLSAFSVDARSSIVGNVGDARLNAWSPFKKETPPPAVVEEPVELVPGPLTTKNAAAAVVWVSLIVWAFGFAPGELGAAADNALIEKLVTQPVPRPEDVNELWFAVWNCFTVVPLVLAALTAPYGRGQRLPAAPFLWGSGAFGYFALGPYFATRTERTTPPESREDLGWASRTVFESRVFALLLTAVTLSIPFSSDLLAPGFDLAATAADFANLAGQSTFVSVATADISIMSALAAVLVSEDCKVRGWEDKAVPLLLGTLLLPVLGPCLYLCARPSLE